MTDVICPFCGAPNPPEAETCKVCNNPLSDTPSEDFNLAEGDQPEWLKDLRNFDSDESGNKPFGTESSEAEGKGQPEEEVPEWLARVRQRSQEDHEEEPNQGDQPSAEPESGSSTPFLPDELPSWLFSDDETKEEAESSFSEPGGMDWMSVVRDNENPPDEGQSLPAELKGTPNWAKFGAKAGENLPKSSSGEEIPPTKSEFTEQTESGREDSGNRDLTARQAEQTSELDSHPPSKNVSGVNAFIPDRSNFQTEIPESSQDETESGSLVPGSFESSDNQPDSHSYDDSGIEPVEAKKPPRPSLRDELLKAPDRPAKIDSYIEPVLEEAQLPSWLEAMKPIESVAPAHFSAEADQQVESSGPLAGFQGILPGGNLTGAYSKPPVYSPKLKVSDKQRVYASLLENLIADEAKAPPEESVKPAVSGIYLRLIVAVVLVGILIFISMTGLQIGIAPNLFAPESVAFFDVAKQLSSTSSMPARILVAIEYEPGLSTEVQAAAVHPIQQLLESGANLALISTLPTGPALGEKLVADTATGPTVINIESQVINLGFLPGGSVSLASLGASPPLAAPTTLSGEPAWSTPILQNIKSIADFDGLILLTDNTELARTWIEQVQPALSGKPFLVISSAQSAPMILPYYNSGQIQGLVAGLNGGAVYDQLAQHDTGVTGNYWTAYQAELLLIVLAILAGALFFGVRGLFHGQPTGGRS